MSNIAKQPVKIEPGVTITLTDGRIVVNGPKGELSEKAPNGVIINLGDQEVTFQKKSETRELEKFAGLARAIVANMIEGVTTGFKKQLELTGVGYRAKVEGQDLVLNVGFALPVRIKPKEGVTISVEENVITVAGSSKQLVGDLAQIIRAVRPPDPYKGKGIKYMGERLRRKVGKAAKAVGGAK